VTLDLSQMTKADVYAAAQDLARRLDRQIAISDALRAEVIQLAVTPCFHCSIIQPELDRLTAAHKQP
jgi:exosome complex RNA-binding protein Csl4